MSISGNEWQLAGGLVSISGQCQLVSISACVGVD